MTAVKDEGQVGVAVGRSWPRLDSREKVLGSTRYAADVHVPMQGLLHARLVLSVYAHARIDSIDRSAALAVPGVVAVLTIDDLPIKGAADMRMFQPLARHEVVFAGQPVAIVVAESEGAAEDGVQAVSVEYTPLQVVVDTEAAMQPGATIARPHRHTASEDGGGASPHAAVGGGDEAASPHAAVGGGAKPRLKEELSANVIGRHWHHNGDVDAVLASSEATVSGHFETDWVYQAYIEPHTATAWIEGSGELVVSSSTQGVFYTRSQLAKIYGLPANKVRSIGAPLGGAFGSKILIAEPLAAGAALAVRRPVRLAMTRREDFMATNPAPGSRFEVTLGGNSDGHLTGLKARMVFDSGAYSEWTIESIAAILVAGPYRWDAHDVRAYGVETNRVGTGSYRGPGGPQASFALESLLDELATKLGLDPIELRLRNGVIAGDRMVDGEPWVQIGVREVLSAVQRHQLWQRRHQLPSGEGVGVAVGVWPGGKEPAAAICRLEADGTITVITGVVDMTGVASGFATIAADAFGIDVRKVNVVAADTSSAPRSPLSGGSVVTYSAGRAVQRAVEAMREKLLRFAAEDMEIDPSDLEVVDGRVQPKGAPGRGRSVAELAEKLDGFGVTFEPVEGHGGTIPPSLAPSTSAHLAHVRVDEESGQVTVLGYVIAQDVGRALNP
ncbi:MAG TPA: xanthine dehydrogenase family protein molybdopterin-binding subunit, partial [Candidatus Saccharimonadales bacterium]|nr:xanthine dehydrogenase family protein molybdopterin-binding subunit [Candidatus Saccharimonadales bacterium]